MNTLTILIGLGMGLAGFLLSLLTFNSRLRKERQEARQSEYETQDAEFGLTEKLMGKYKELQKEVMVLIEESTIKESRLRELAESENAHKQHLQKINQRIEDAKAKCVCGAWV